MITINESVEAIDTLDVMGWFASQHHTADAPNVYMHLPLAERKVKMEEIRKTLLDILAERPVDKTSAAYYGIRQWMIAHS